MSKHHKSMRHLLGNFLQQDIFIPDKPHMVGAFGEALLAAER